MRILTNIFKALSDETRLQMLSLLLKEGELCVCDFVEVLQITQSKASRHLRHLVNVGLLDDRRHGTWVYFRIADKPEPAQTRVIELLPVILDNRISPELFVQLADWRKSRDCSGSSSSDLLSERAAKRGARR